MQETRHNARENSFLFLCSSVETNTTDIRIFVRFALFKHNLCYPTIRLQPCGFAHALLVRLPGVGMHIIGGDMYFRHNDGMCTA